MKNIRKLAYSLFICGYIGGLTSVFAHQAPTSVTIERFGDKVTLTQKTFKNDGNTRWEIYGNGYCIAQPFQASNLLAFKIFSDADKYCRKIHSNPSNNTWHKNINRYNSDSDFAETTVETLASKDTVIELSITNSFTNMAYLKTTNNSVIKEATGYNLIGMSPDEVESIFGTYQTSIENDVPFMVYSFYIDGGSMYELKLGLEDGRVSEINIYNNAPGECDQKYGERTYYEGELPEGWFTKGIVTSINLNVRKEPKTGEVITKIGTEHPEFMFSEVRDTGEDYKWVKIITKVDYEKRYTTPVEGWVYAKFISPSFKSFGYRNALTNSFEYFAWLLALLPKETSIEARKPDENNACDMTRKWENQGLTIKTQVQGDGTPRLIFGELTKNTYAFAGLKVGDNIGVLKKFDENLKKAGLGLSDNQKISDNSSIKWENEEESQDGYSYKIEVETKSGKISKIKFSR